MKTLAIIIALFLAALLPQGKSNKPTPTQKPAAERTYTAAELQAFDGTDPAKPIYLALDGNVYDVTAGSEFYRPGGTYHFLAGRDSTEELHIAGAGIIKRKYPIVGKFGTAN